MQIQFVKEIYCTDQKIHTDHKVTITNNGKLFNGRLVITTIILYILHFNLLKCSPVSSNRQFKEEKRVDLLTGQVKNSS